MGGGGGGGEAGADEANRLGGTAGLDEADEGEGDLADSPPRLGFEERATGGGGKPAELIETLSAESEAEARTRPAGGDNDENAARVAPNPDGDADGGKRLGIVGAGPSSVPAGAAENELDLFGSGGISVDDPGDDDAGSAPPVLEGGGGK